MKELVSGKGIYAWMLSRCDGGDMKSVINTLKQAGMTHIIPKIADGNYEYALNTPYLAELVTLAHSAGIKVIPYHFVYGTYAESEAIRIIQELNKHAYDGLVINGEASYKMVSNPSASAKIYCEKLRGSYPDLPLYLSTYRYPTYHRTFPFDTFLYYCDAAMPQVYWMEANGTVPEQLERTLLEYSNLGVQRPIIPTGAAFKEHGWIAIPEDQAIFIDEVKKAGLGGCNWWEYYHTFNLIPELGQAIIQTPFEEVEQPPTYPLPPSTDPDGPIFQAKCLAQKLKIRSTPQLLADNSNYINVLEFGDIVNVYEEHYNDGINWYRIGKNQWCSGHPTYMEKLELPEPEPEPDFTTEEKVDIMWNEMFPNGYKES